jgi:hypothetical protein
LRQAIQDSREELLEAQTPFSTFHVAGVLQPGATLDLDTCEQPVHRLLVLDPLDLTDPDVCTWLDEVVVVATGFLVPVQVALAKATARSVEAAVGLGTAGVIVSPGQVRAAKERIRVLNASACRAELARSR